MAMGSEKKLLDFLIVGAGFTGAVLAQQIACRLKKQVLIIDKRSHIAGNAYDCYNENHVFIHQYGPHIFHTKQKGVFDYLSRFTSWNGYQHRVLACVENKFFPFPINRKTINEFFGLRLQTEEETAQFLAQQKEKIPYPKNAEEKVLSIVGRRLYESFFKEYTKKAWGCDPKELSASVTARIPVRLCENDNYFDDPYQGLPQMGYTHLFHNLLDHPLIRIELNTPFDFQQKKRAKHVIYTGPIDEYFQYKLGRLPFRSLQFVFETFAYPQHQSHATINYPDQRPYTRITEFKHMTKQKIGHTTICKELPQAALQTDEKHYPIPTPKNTALYGSYQKLAKGLGDVTFCGRLGDYKYYNMDHAVYRALSLFEQKFL